MRFICLHRPYLITISYLKDISPLVFLDLNENFDHTELNFSLHDGARIYLEKDEPGFFERYAEMIGVLFTLILAGVSGLVSLAKWRNQNKKDRIDTFYKRVLDVQVRIPHLKSRSDVIEALNHLEEGKQEAFSLLIDEKLSANESFRIYMELHKEIQQELECKLEEEGSTIHVK